MSSVSGQALPVVTGCGSSEPSSVPLRGPWSVGFLGAVEPWGWVGLGNGAGPNFSSSLVVTLRFLSKCASLIIFQSSELVALTVCARVVVRVVEKRAFREFYAAVPAHTACSFVACLRV